jgi:hypothetical protein
MIDLKVPRLRAGRDRRGAPGEHLRPGAQDALPSRWVPGSTMTRAAAVSRHSPSTSSSLVAGQRHQVSRRKVRQSG